LQVCLTANSPHVGPDLITRCVPIELFFEGNPLQREFSIRDPEGFVETYRTELLGELVGMVEAWKSQGRPMANVSSRFNKRDWGRIVGGVLDVSGARGFMTNFSDAQRSLDPVRVEFEALAQAIAADRSPPSTPSEWAERAVSLNLLTIEFVDSKSERSRSTRMGCVLSRFVGERLEIGDGRTVQVARRTKGNNSTYIVEEAR
jgi:hypothetical protein